MAQDEENLALKQGGNNILKFMQDFMKIPVRSAQDTSPEEETFEDEKAEDIAGDSLSFLQENSEKETSAKAEEAPASFPWLDDEDQESQNELSSTDKTEADAEAETEEAEDDDEEDEAETEDNEAEEEDIEDAETDDEAEPEEDAEDAETEENKKAEDETEDDNVLEISDETGVPSASDTNQPLQVQEEDSSLTSPQETSVSDKEKGELNTPDSTLPSFPEEFEEEEDDSLEEDIKDVLTHLDAVSQHLQDLSDSLRRVIRGLRKKI